MNFPSPCLEYKTPQITPKILNKISVYDTDTMKSTIKSPHEDNVYPTFDQLSKDEQTRKTV